MRVRNQEHRADRADEALRRPDRGRRLHDAEVDQHKRAGERELDAQPHRRHRIPGAVLQG